VYISILTVQLHTKWCTNPVRLITVETEFGRVCLIFVGSLYGNCLCNSPGAWNLEVAPRHCKICALLCVCVCVCVCVAGGFLHLIDGRIMLKLYFRYFRRKLTGVSWLRVGIQITRTGYHACFVSGRSRVWISAQRPEILNFRSFPRKKLPGL